MQSLIRLADRADHATELARSGLGQPVRVLDLQPAAPIREPAAVRALGQCSSCTMVSYLEGRDDLRRFAALEPLRSLFGAVVELSAARAVDDGRTVARVARGVGASAVLQLRDPEAERAPLGLPAMTIVRRPEELEAAEQSVLVEPTGAGRGVVVETVRAAHARGARVHLGYAEHAAAIDGYVDFLESEPDVLGRLAFDLRDLPSPRILMAFPPCSALQWGDSRRLEAERARTDTVFRSLQGESSRMCAENVSGYSMVEDCRSSLGDLEGTSWLLRWDDLLLVIP